MHGRSCGKILPKEDKTEFSNWDVEEKKLNALMCGVFRETG